jgi:hypothetical protein
MYVDTLIFKLRHFFIWGRRDFWGYGLVIAGITVLSAHPTLSEARVAFVGSSCSKLRLPKALMMFQGLEVCQRPK